MPNIEQITNRKKLQEALTLKVKDVVDSQLEDIVNKYKK